MEKETLEESAENFANSKEWMNGGASNWVQFSFKKGAKWQAKRGYSEEEVLEFANWCRIQDNKYPNRVITIQQLLEQFKKK